MTKTEMSTLQNELSAVFKKHGLTVTKNRLGYDSDGSTINVTIRGLDKKAAPKKSASSSDLANGFAAPNTKAFFRYRDGRFYEVTILEARRSRYVCEWTHYSDEGRFTIPFHCAVAKSTFDNKLISK